MSGRRITVLRGACAAGALAVAVLAVPALRHLSEERIHSTPAILPVVAALAVWALARRAGRPTARLALGATALAPAGAALWWGSRWWTQLSATSFSDPWLLGVCALMLLAGAVLVTELVAAGLAQHRARAAHEAEVRARADSARGEVPAPLGSPGRLQRLLWATTGAAAAVALVAAGGAAIGQSWRLEPEELVQHSTAEVSYPAVASFDDESPEVVWTRRYPERLAALLSAEAGPIVVTDLRVEALDGRTGEVRWTYTRGDVPGMLDSRAGLVNGKVWLGCGIVLDATTGEVLGRDGHLDSLKPPAPLYEGWVDLYGPDPVLELWPEGSARQGPALWQVVLDADPYLGLPAYSPATAQAGAGALAVAVTLRQGASQPTEHDAGHTVVYGLR